MNTNVGMLGWIVLGALLAGYGGLFLRFSVPSNRDQEAEKEGGLRRWLRRQRPRDCAIIGVVGLTLALTCFAAAAGHYQEASSRADSRVRAKLDPTLQELVDDMIDEHRQAQAQGRRAQWCNAIIALGHDGVRLMAQLFDHFDNNLIKSDLLYCMQKVTGHDLGLYRGQMLTPEQIDQSYASVRSWRRSRWLGR